MIQKPKFPFQTKIAYELNGKTEQHDVVLEAENGWHAITLVKKLHLPSGAKVTFSSAHKVLPKKD
jgi:hypothetical protein